MSIPIQLVIATGMVALTVLVHLIGLSVLIGIMRKHGHRFSHDKARFGQAALVVGVVLGLIGLHTVEIWSYAVLFRLGHAVGSFEDALLFATSSYVTSGAPEISVGRAWRLIGAIEGANGIILLGWSTAFFVSIIARIRAIEDDWTHHQ